MDSQEALAENLRTILLAIQEAMDGVEWTPDTLDTIAKIMREAGYLIRDTNDRDGEVAP